MTLIEKTLKSIYLPMYPIILFLFLAITSLHLQVQLLKNMHIEALSLGAVIALSFIYFYYNKNDFKNNDNALTIGVIIGALFIISPLITSLYNQDFLEILYDDEYRTMIKIFIFSPTLIFVTRNDKNKKILINSFIFLYSLFALYFLYRFLILHEVRDFDQRPKLNIRHGDANFLCTFFSMMIPIPLMQAYNSYKKKYLGHTFLYISSAMLLLISSLLTQSRMGFISVFIGIFYLITRSIFSISKPFMLTAFILGIISISPMSNTVMQRFTEIQDKSNSDRYLTWKNGIEVFEKFPLLGSGMHKGKNFFYQHTGYPDFQSEVSPLDIHNTFLKTAAELGTWGFLVFLILFCWPWKKVLRMASQERYFLISSMTILTISIMTIGVVYKDLFIAHLYFITALATNSKKKEQLTGRLISN